MIDIVDQETRSRIMAHVRSKHTKPELALRRAIHARGLRYKLHDRNLPGSPDLAFPRFGAVCFVHGCFWHRHVGCRYATTPATRRDFWRAKFSENVNRDRRATRALNEAGWRVAIVWECALRNCQANSTAQALEKWLRSTERIFETGLDWHKDGSENRHRYR